MEQRQDDIGFEDFGQHVSTEELDLAVKQIRQAKEDYEQKSAVSKEAHFHLENCKKALVDLLSKAGKTKYEAEGVGKVGITERLSVKYPKSLEERREFKQWIEGKLGEEGLLTYLTVNSATLNSLYKEEFEKAKEIGDPSEFRIPGIDEPTASLTVRFNKA